MLTTIVVGKENVGKSTLVGALAGVPVPVANLAGSTLSCERYRAGDLELVDAPGLLLEADRGAVGDLLARTHDAGVLLVLHAAHLEADLVATLPLVADRHGAAVVTFRDKLEARPGAGDLDRLRERLGVDVHVVDARQTSDGERQRLLASLRSPRPFAATSPTVVSDPASARPTSAPKASPRLVGLRAALAALVGLGLLVAPTFAAALFANAIAGRLEPIWLASSAGLAGWLGGAPWPLAEVLVGRYGLVSMGPLLLLWALPTVFLHALLMGVYKVTGLLDRAAAAVAPMVRPFGLHGRDLARVMMGFGCNVPAVTATRTCAPSTRDACVSAIAFGSACSYRLGATLAVFAAAGRPGLVVPWAVALAVGALAAARWTAGRGARRRSAALRLLETTTYLQWPNLPALVREVRPVLSGFLRTALPIFLAVAVSASLLDAFGALGLLERGAGLGVAVLGLPAVAGLAIVVSAIRKDGVLLLAAPTTLAALTPAQLLGAVFFAGVAVPCLVTAMTMARERSPRVMVGMVGRQLALAALLTLVLVQLPV